MLTLSTSPELEKALGAEAQKFGLTAEQHALNILARNVAPVAPEQSDEEFEAALDELIGCAEGVDLGTKKWRAIKDEEMALEEEKHERRFGRSRTA